MPRPIWQGTVSFGLVTIPVGLYAAEERTEGLSFHLLHKKDGSRVELKRFCAAEGVAVPWSEIVKGYEYAKGEHVVMTDDDFAKARVPATETFEIQAFVDAAQVEDLYFDQPYYLVPAVPQGAKAYALLRDALREARKIGIGTIVLRQREHLAALEPTGEALVLTTMRFAHEIRSAKHLPLPKIGEGWNQKEMELAQRLIASVVADWKPAEYTDSYTEVLKQAIQQKIEGKEISIPAAARPAAIADLMEALEESLKKQARKELAKAEGRPPKPTRRRRSA